MGFWNRNKEQRAVAISVSDPAFLDFFGLGKTFTNQRVSEDSILSLSAMWRATNLIAGTIAGLPLKTFETATDGVRDKVGSFLDNPAGPDSQTAFEWIETLLFHMILYGEGFALHRKNSIGAILGLELIHPTRVSVKFNRNVPGDKIFTVTTDVSDSEINTFEVTSENMLHIPAPSTDGLRGMGLIHKARNSFGIYQASEESAARMFANGALIAGLVTPVDTTDLKEGDAERIKDSIRNKMLGTQNSGDIAVINRALKFEPWQMTNEDAQWLQTRAFQVEEIARWTGVPPHLLMQTEKQTSWGTGIEEQHRALSRHTLMPWTTRIEQRLDTLLRSPKFVEFDFAGLQQPTTKDEITLLINQVNAGLLTLNEARAIRNMPPVDGGDVPRGLAGEPTLEQFEVGELEEASANGS